MAGLLDIRRALKPSYNHQNNASDNEQVREDGCERQAQTENATGTEPDERNRHRDRDEAYVVIRTYLHVHVLSALLWTLLVGRVVRYRLLRLIVR